MATNAVAIRPQQGVSRYEQREVIETIKQTVCKGASDAQLKMFLEVCKATGLDPFLKEIWFVAEKSIIMAGRDGYLRVANEHPQFDGIETRVERDERNVPIKAVCTVWRKDRTHPTICEAYYNEYKSGSPVWTKYPSAMIGKVAEVLALKRSFAINGVVSEEEMGAEYAAPQLTPQQVAQQKIAAMQAGKPYAEVSSPDPRTESEPIEVQTEAAPLDFLNVEVFKAATKFERLKMFALMKEAIGEEPYYRILGNAGVEHANQFTSLRAACNAYAEMVQEYRDQIASRGVA